DPRRAAGAVLHLIGRAADDGHVFLPRAELASQALRLEVPPALVEPAVDALCAREMLVCEEDRVYAPPLHRAAVRAAERLVALARPRAGRTEAAAKLSLPAHLSELQKHAVATALQHGLMVLTGGPGTGKTTTVEAIVQAHEALDLRVTLCAPTGRAAKRMSEA